MSHIHIFDVGSEQARRSEMFELQETSDDLGITLLPRQRKNGCFISLRTAFILFLAALVITVVVGVSVHYAAVSNFKQCYRCWYHNIKYI